MYTNSARIPEETMRRFVGVGALARWRGESRVRLCVRMCVRERVCVWSRERHVSGVAGVAGVAGGARRGAARAARAARRGALALGAGATHTLAVGLAQRRAGLLVASATKTCTLYLCTSE